MARIKASLAGNGDFIGKSENAQVPACLAPLTD